MGGGQRSLFQIKLGWLVISRHFRTLLSLYQLLVIIFQFVSIPNLRCFSVSFSCEILMHNLHFHHFLHFRATFRTMYTSLAFKTDSERDLVTSRWTSRCDILLRLRSVRSDAILKRSQSEYWTVTWNKEI